jgi:hypothetical protein
VGVISEQQEVQDIIGWREWVTLPDLGIRHVKAKIDTGARTSALHAHQVECFQEMGMNKVRFAIYPRQHFPKHSIICETELLELRWVIDSGGHREQRPVIRTLITLAGKTWPIEITLTSRDDMSFRMLLGRTAMLNRFVVDPSSSYLQSKNKRNSFHKV